MQHLAAILLAACLAQAAIFVPSARAQDLGQVVSPILTIDRDRLFAESAYGQRINAKLEAERARLEAETRAIEAALEAEELELTEKRASLPADEFRALADAFDAKVQTLRNEREAAQQRFVQDLDNERLAFFEQVLAILFELGQELGAVAILDHRVVLLPLADIDVTAMAVGRIDERLGSGAGDAD